MIKISDLSVGDWVKVKECAYFPLDKPNDFLFPYAKVTALEDENCIIWLNTQAGEFCASLKNIESIPITAEILEKNGFRKNGEYNEWNIGEWNERPFIGVSLDRQSMRVKYFGNDIFIENKVVYVHQLQHALRLAGVEKEINL